jgi:hypothetical protein
MNNRKRDAQWHQTQNNDEEMGINCLTLSGHNCIHVQNITQYLMNMYISYVWIVSFIKIRWKY